MRNQNLNFELLNKMRPKQPRPIKQNQICLLCKLDSTEPVLLNVILIKLVKLKVRGHCQLIDFHLYTNVKN